MRFPLLPKMYRVEIHAIEDGHDKVLQGCDIGKHFWEPSIKAQRKEVANLFTERSLLERSGVKVVARLTDGDRKAIFNESRVVLDERNELDIVPHDESLVE